MICNKFDETYQFFPRKKSLLYKKHDFFYNFFVENFALYCLDTEPESEPSLCQKSELEPEP